MNPLAWLIGLALPACGFAAADGLPKPPLMDTTAIVRPSSPNTVLAAPVGVIPAPDVVTETYQIAAARLFDLVQAVAGAQPRTYQAAIYSGALQVHYVARSAMLNFPDLVTVQVIEKTADASGLLLYSRSVYGYSDLGVNRKRVKSWLQTLHAKLPSASER